MEFDAGVGVERLDGGMNVEEYTSVNPRVLSCEWGVILGKIMI